MEFTQSKVERVDLFGDYGILDAARVSFAKQSFLSEHNPEKDFKLLKYLISHGHWSPMGHERLGLLIEEDRLKSFLLVADLAGFTWEFSGDQYTRTPGNYLYCLAGSFWAWVRNAHYFSSTDSKLHEGLTYIVSCLWRKWPMAMQAYCEVFPDDIVSHTRHLKDVPYTELSAGPKTTFASFRVKAPIFIARQLVKHQIHLCWNEESRRYISSDPEYFDIPEFRKAPEKGKAKQGSSQEKLHRDTQTMAQTMYKVCSLDCHERYLLMIDRGVAPEQARAILPQGMMVNWIWTGSLDAWSRVVKERLAPTAQKENQDIAAQIDNLLGTAANTQQIWKALRQ